MPTLGTIDYTTLADTSPGVLPNFDNGQVATEVHLTNLAGNAGHVHSHGAQCDPTVSNQVQGFYHTFNTPARPTLILISWIWFENKPITQDKSGPVAAVMNGPLTTSGTSNLNVPPIACHFGCSRNGWHIDTPAFFFGMSPVAQGTFKTPLAVNTVYTMALAYTAVDKIKLTLPDGSTTAEIQNGTFNGNAGNWGFTEIWLGSGTDESNARMVKEQIDTVQWPGAPVAPPPPPPGTSVKQYRPTCLSESGVSGPDDTAANADVWAQGHIASHSGHIVKIETIWK